MTIRISCKSKSIRYIYTKWHKIRIHLPQSGIFSTDTSNIINSHLAVPFYKILSFFFYHSFGFLKRTSLQAKTAEAKSQIGDKIILSFSTAMADDKLNVIFSRQLHSF